ncbi:MAG: cache domain-containing protein [Nitrosotalea sp.]
MDSKSVLAVFFFAAVLSLAGVILYYSEYAFYGLDQAAVDKKNYFEKTVSQNMGYALNKTRDILETTSHISDVYNVPNVASVDPKLHGIPKEMDTPKRVIADQVLSEDTSLETVFFFLPNGDSYVIEPYSQQLQVASSNFAFRDFYKGAVETHKPYLSGAFKSQATGHDIAVIAVPIYSGNGTLTGVWGGAMNLAEIQSDLNVVDVGKNGVVSIVDAQGYVVAQSGSYKIQNTQLSNLDAYTNAISGKSGTITEDINGTKMLVSYNPVPTFSGTWVMLTIIPYDTSYELSTTMKSFEITLLPLLAIISIIFVIIYQRQD